MKPSKDVIEFMKAGGDYKSFLKRDQKIKYHKYLKHSTVHRDNFEHELTKLLSTRLFENAKKKTEKLKHPPMGFYEKFLNHNILD